MTHFSIYLVFDPRITYEELQIDYADDAEGLEKIESSPLCDKSEDVESGLGLPRATTSKMSRIRDSVTYAKL